MGNNSNVTSVISTQYHVGMKLFADAILNMYVHEEFYEHINFLEEKAPEVRKDYLLNVHSGISLFFHCFIH